jgi:hypothetical protein
VTVTNTLAYHVMVIKAPVRTLANLA